MNLPAPREQPIAGLYLLPSPAEIERMKLAAYERYANHPHADLRVGRAEYRAALDAIEQLSGKDNGCG